jgi:hypothetical protein
MQATEDGRCGDSMAIRQAMAFWLRDAIFARGQRPIGNRT